MSKKRSSNAKLKTGLLGQLSGTEKRLGIVINSKGVIYQKKQ